MKITVDHQITEHAKGIVDSIAHWKDIAQNGCNDPFWEDGVNMNLARNHIIYHKYNLEEICRTFNRPLPQEYYLPLPPKVSQHYMANLSQVERVKQLRQMGNKLETEKIKYDEQQLSFA